MATVSLAVEAPAPAQQLRQALAVDQLEHEKRPSLVLTDVVDRDRVRMVEAGREPGLAFEARDGARVAHRRPEELDRDRPAEPAVERGVHITETAGADSLADLVPVVQRIRHARKLRAGWAQAVRVA